VVDADPAQATEFGLVAGQQRVLGALQDKPQSSRRFVYVSGFPRCVRQRGRRSCASSTPRVSNRAHRMSGGGRRQSGMTVQGLRARATNTGIPLAAVMGVRLARDRSPQSQPSPWKAFVRGGGRPRATPKAPVLV
jgi:hypothetical protein